MGKRDPQSTGLTASAASVRAALTAAGVAPTDFVAPSWSFSAVRDALLPGIKSLGGQMAALSPALRESLQPGPDAYTGSTTELLRAVRLRFSRSRNGLGRKALDIALRTKVGTPFAALALAGHDDAVARLRDLAGTGDDDAAEALHLLALLDLIVRAVLSGLWADDLRALLLSLATGSTAGTSVPAVDHTGPPGELVRQSPAVVRGPSFPATSGVPFPGASVVARAA